MSIDQIIYIINHYNSNMGFIWTVKGGPALPADSPDL